MQILMCGNDENENNMIMAKRQDIIDKDLWRIFPVINVNRVKDIPIDYPGAMGVLITFMNHIQKNDGKSGFVLLGCIRPTLNEKKIYRRLLIRNLNPNLPEEFDIEPYM